MLGGTLLSRSEPKTGVEGETEPAKTSRTKCRIRTSHDNHKVFDKSMEKVYKAFDEYSAGG